MQNYEGMAAIRTGNYFAGFNDLTNDPDTNIIDEGEKLPTFHGTLLTIKLLPGRAKTLGRYYPTSNTPEENAANCEHLSITVSNVAESIKIVAERSNKDSSMNLLISLNFSGFSYEKYNNEEELDTNLRELLYGLSSLRHPNFYIVYGFPANILSSRIEKIVNGVNEYIIRRKEEENKYLEFDPIMIIGPKGSIHWVVVQKPNLLLLLNRLIETQELSFPIESINQEDRGELIAAIKQDKVLFNIQDEGRIKLNFNKNAPIDYLINKLKIKIKDLVDDCEQKKRVFITPNLSYAKGWLGINKIEKDADLNNECALALYSLWNSNREKILREFFPACFKDNDKQTLVTNENHRENIIANNKSKEPNRILDEIQRNNLKNNLKILVESEVDKTLGNNFLQFLDIEELHNNLKVLSDETDDKKPRRMPLFEKSDYVIIISSVVSTRETASSMVKAVLRSNATPIALLSLADISGEYDKENQNYVSKVLNTDQNNIWGVKVFYFSFFPDNSLKVDKKYDNLKFINPNDYKEEPPNYDESFYIKDAVREKILKSKSLHFSHIGKPNGRHFTFYFNV